MAYDTLTEIPGTYGHVWISTVGEGDRTGEERMVPTSSNPSYRLCPPKCPEGYREYIGKFTLARDIAAIVGERGLWNVEVCYLVNEKGVRYSVDFAGYGDNTIIPGTLYLQPRFEE